jgi:putative flippase GtrA
MKKKDIAFSLICGFLSSIFLSFAVFNKEIVEFEKVPFLKLFKQYYFFIFFLLPFLFFLALKIASFFPFSLFFQFAKFLEVGVLNTFLDIGTLNILSSFTKIFSGPKIIFLNSLSFLLAVTNSYFWNKFWTFEKELGIKTQEFSLFLIVSFIGLTLNSAIVYVGTTFLTLSSISVGASMNVIKILATFFSMVWNFLGYKIFVFKK